ncbi:hypothetical protein S922_09070 [Salmonella enterica subsp. enterica]|nr:hypothetical protein [Salmonella enterica subsp. enterica]EAW9771295.1 hypothetical protein [Salmonella enterica]
MNKRPSSVPALPGFACQRSGRTREANIDGKAVNAVCMKVKKSSDLRVLSGSTFFLADSPTASKQEVRFIRKRDAVTLRLNAKREKKLSEGEILVVNRTAGIVATEQGVYPDKGGKMTAISQTKADSVKLLITMKTGWRKKSKRGYDDSRKAKVQVINSTKPEFIGREFWLILHWRLADKRVIPPMRADTTHVLRAVIDNPSRDKLHLKSTLLVGKTTNKCLYVCEVKE